MPITYDQLTRKERMSIWLKRNNMDYASIADAIGEKYSTVAHWFIAETIPLCRHRRLEALGIPAELLPPGVNRRRGRKPRSHDGPVLALPPAAADAHILDQ